MERVEGKRPCLSVDLSDMPAGGSVPFTVNSVCLSRVSQCLMCLSVFVLTSHPTCMMPAGVYTTICMPIDIHMCVCMCCMCVHTLLAACPCACACRRIYPDRQTDEHTFA